MNKGILLIILFLVGMNIAFANTINATWDNPRSGEMVSSTVKMSLFLDNVSCTGNCGSADKRITNITFFYRNNVGVGGSDVLIGQNSSVFNVSNVSQRNPLLAFDTNVLDDSLSYVLTFKAYNYTIFHADNVTATTTAVGIISDNSKPTCVWEVPKSTDSDIELAIPFSFKIIAANSTRAIIRVNNEWRNMTQTVSTANSQTYTYNISRGSLGEGGYDIEATSYDRHNQTAGYGNNATSCPLLRDIWLDDQTSSMTVRAIAEEHALAEERAEEQKDLLLVGGIILLGYVYWRKK